VVAALPVFQPSITVKVIQVTKTIIDHGKIGFVLAFGCDDQEIRKFLGFMLQQPDGQALPMRCFLGAVHRVPGFLKATTTFRADLLKYFLSGISQCWQYTFILNLTLVSFGQVNFLVRSSPLLESQFPRVE
jgi:hypothetical protein